MARSLTLAPNSPRGWRTQSLKVTQETAWKKLLRAVLTTGERLSSKHGEEKESMTMA